MKNTTTTDTVTETTACRIYGVSPCSSNRHHIRKTIKHVEEPLKGKTTRRYLVTDILDARAHRFNGTIHQ